MPEGTRQRRSTLSKKSFGRRIWSRDRHSTRFVPELVHGALTIRQDYVVQDVELPADAQRRTNRESLGRDRIGRSTFSDHAASSLLYQADVNVRDEDDGPCDEISSASACIEVGPYRVGDRTVAVDLNSPVLHGASVTQVVENDRPRPGRPRDT